MTNTYIWATPKGANISATITVKHITTETVYADGLNIEVKCDRWARNVDSMTVNGRPTKMRELYNEDGIDCILIDRVGNNRILVALPDDVVTAIYAEERNDAARKLAATIAAEKAYEAHINAVKKMMDM